MELCFSRLMFQRLDSSRQMWSSPSTGSICQSMFLENSLPEHAKKQTDKRLPAKTTFKNTNIHGDIVRMCLCLELLAELNCFLLLLPGRRRGAWWLLSLSILGQRQRKLPGQVTSPHSGSHPAHWEPPTRPNSRFLDSEGNWSMWT